jgi:putative flippase GtrA
MTLAPGSRFEALTAAKFAAVSLMGFAIDALLLRAGVSLGLSPLAGRAISLICAMQATFLVNGALVFRCLRLSRCGRQWLGYMAASSFGNMCNYAIFAALVVSHVPWLSLPLVALTVGSMTAGARRAVRLRQGACRLAVQPAGLVLIGSGCLRLRIASLRALDQLNADRFARVSLAGPRLVQAAGRDAGAIGEGGGKG